MTLSTRNRFLGAAFLATLPAIGALLYSFPALIGAAAEASSAADHRAAGIAASVFAAFFPASVSSVLAALTLMCLYASAVVALLYYYFEKTQTPEILFFAFFAFSFIAEAARVAIPLAQARDWPPAIVVAAARAIWFGRFFGTISLFAASVYANGIEFQKHGRVLIIIAITALSVATGIPVDGLTYDTAFTPLPGYRNMIDLTELSIALIAVLSFLVAAYSKSAREFYAASGGALLVVVGRDLLLRGDSWATVPAGAALLAAGTWLFASRIHRYYLWL